MAQNIPDKKPLLEDADNNIGNSSRVNPQAGTAGTIMPQAAPGEAVRILNLRSGSSRGQTTSIIVTASRVIPNNPSGSPGPITGIVEFGNGSTSTRVEFDVPIGPFAGQIGQPVPSIQPQDGGVIVSVPTGVLRVYARYDNLLVSPAISFVPTPIPQSLAQIFGVPFLGPNAGMTSESLLVKAMACYFTQPKSRTYKTNYLYVGGAAINVNTRQFFCLPAFTKKLKVLRMPINHALNIVLHNGISIVDQVDLVAGTSCPEIPVVGHECIVGLQSPLPADSYTFLALACELGV
jgi:hypothetical protein